MTTLNSHQLEAIAKIQESFQSSQSFLLADDVGLGKSRVACQIARQTTSTDQVIIVAPLSTHGGWLQEAAVIGLDAAVAGIMWPSTKAVIVNYERLDKYKEIGVWNNTPNDKNAKEKTFYSSPFSLVIWDECFPRGTPVETIIGSMGIENIIPGTLVKTPIGPRKVLRSIKTQGKSKLIKITHQHGELICTPNHKLFTKYGWKQAKDCLGLELTLISTCETVGHISYENKEMSSLQNQIQSQQIDSNLLRSIMCNEGDFYKPSRATPASFSNDERQSQIKGGGENKDDYKQSHEEGRCQEEGFRYPQENWPSPKGSRRKWLWNNKATSNSISEPFWMGSGISGLAQWQKEIWMAYNGGRSSVAIIKDRRGMRRTISFCAQEARNRFEKECSLNEGRLDGVEILEQDNFKRIAKSVGNHTKSRVVKIERIASVDYVYNLEVEDCHCYYANNILVSNCHKLKGYDTKRYKIWQAITKMARRTLYLTATPGQDPMELRYLAGVIGITDSQFWNWVRQFKGIWKPQWGGLKFRPGHLEDTQKLLKITQNNPRAMRRTAKDIVGWPELQRIIQPVRLTASEGHDYEVAFEDYLQAISEANKTIHPQSHRLVASGQFRKRLSEIKVPYTVDLAKNLLEQGKVVTISCEYLSSVALIKAWLDPDYRVAVIQGDVNTGERQDILLKSKSDQLDVIIFTPQEGINLHQIEDGHRSRCQIDHDIRWSALAMHQIDGRTHRAGVHAPVYWMTCHEAIDHKVAIRLKERMETLGAINGELEPIDFLA